MADLLLPQDLKEVLEICISQILGFLGRFKDSRIPGTTIVNQKELIPLLKRQQLPSA